VGGRQGLGYNKKGLPLAVEVAVDTIDNIASTPIV